MILRNSKWEKDLCLNEGALAVIVIEDKEKLWKYSTELVRQSEGEEGDFQLFTDKYAEMSFNKSCDIKVNLVNFIINTKKIQNALAKKCLEDFKNSNLEIQFEKDINSLYSLFSSVCQDQYFSIKLNKDIEPNDIIKLLSPEINENHISLLDKLIEYVNVSISFLGTKLFVFLFLSKFLAVEQILILFKHCQYQDVKLLLIEENEISIEKNTEYSFFYFILDKDDTIIEKAIE